MEDRQDMIDRAQIEDTARRLEQAVDDTKQAARDASVLAAVGIIAVVGVAFWLGRRRGARGKTVVEVYEVR